MSWSKILTKGAAALSATLNAVAPKLLTRVHEFSDHYQSLVMFEDHIVANPKQEIESLSAHFSVPQHLSAMVKLLQQEEEGNQGREPSSCIEFFLDKRVFDLIAAIAVHDKAPHLTCVAVQTLSALLSLRFRWLTQSGACHAMLRVVDTLQTRGPSNHFVVPLTELMCVLAEKFREDPSLLAFFFDSHDPSGIPHFPLFSALLLYVDRASSEGQSARRGVLLCLQTNDSDVVTYLELHSGLIERCIRLLVSSFSRAMDSIVVDDQDRPTMQASGWLASLAFVDAVCHKSHPSLVVRLLSSLELGFFVQTLRPVIAASSEVNMLAGLRLVRAGMGKIKSAPLLAAYCRGVVGSDLKSTENPQERVIPKGVATCHGEQFRLVLESNIDSMNDSVASATMQLFLHLLSLHNVDIYTALLPIEMRHDMKFPPSFDRVKESYGPLFRSLDCGNVPRPNSQRLFIEYVHDARHSLELGASARELWVAEEENEKKEGEEGVSSFVGALLQRLERCLDNSLEVNLLVTGILSRIALHPLDCVFASLMEPHPSQHKPSLFGVLTRLSDEVAKRASRLESFPAKIDATRLALKQRRGGAGGGGGSSSSSSSSGGGGDLPVSSLDEYEAQATRNFLRAIVVLEEFQAELIAIAYARSNEGGGVASPVPASPPPPPSSE